MLYGSLTTEGQTEVQAPEGRRQQTVVRKGVTKERKLKENKAAILL